MKKLVGFLALPHELLHYGAARVLGVEAYIQGNVTWVRKTLPWKSALIALTPAFAGVLMLGACTLALVQPGADRSFWLLMNLAAVSWLLSCALDFQGVWRLLRGRK